MISPVLKIDPEFQAKIPPPSEEEFKQLEENILHDGEVYDPIIVWNKTIIDGHNRYKIIQEHPWLEWHVREVNFANRWEAIAWMCTTQLGRRNINLTQRKLLIGQKNEAQKKSIVRNPDTGRFEPRNQNEIADRNAKRKVERTAEIIAKEYGTCPAVVNRYASMARGYNDIQKASPETAARIISGQQKVHDVDLQAIDHASPEEKPAMIQAVIENRRVPRSPEKTLAAPEPERPALITAVIEGKPIPKKEPEPKSEPKQTQPSSQPDTPTFSFDKPISTRTKAGQQLMSEIRTVIENQGNGEIIKPTLSVVSEMLMYDVQAMIERFHDFMNTNKEIATEEIVKQIKASINQLSMLKEVLQNS